MTRIVSNERMRAIEAATFAAGLPPLAIMEAAGRAVAAHITAQNVLVVCGRGNNGADGMVTARALKARGVDVCVAHVEHAGSQSPENQLQRSLLSRYGVSEVTDWKAREYDTVVDAVLGIGARGAVSEPLQRAFAKMQKARHLVALDVPSAYAIEAHETITLHAWKTQMTQQREACGDVRCVDIGIADSLFTDEDGVLLEGVALPQAKRFTNVHKGTYGHLAVWGGAEGKSGALTLACLGATYAGAGLVTAIGRAQLPPEVMTAKDLRKVRASAWCIGPGLGPVEHLAEVLATGEVPTVLDADALVAALAPGAAPRVLTPHPLEFSRIFGVSVEDTQRDRVGHARRAAASSGAVVVLKGAGTVVAHPSGRWAVNASGGRALAKGGTGDVLAGIIAGFLAQRAFAGRGIDGAFDAACLGVYVHGAAGDRATKKRGAASVLASQVAAEVPHVMKDAR